MNRRARLLQVVVLLTIGLMAMRDAFDSPRVQSLRGVEIALLVTAGFAFGGAVMTLIGRDPGAKWMKRSVN